MRTIDIDHTELLKFSSGQQYTVTHKIKISVISEDDNATQVQVTSNMPHLFLRGNTEEENQRFEEAWNNGVFFEQSVTFTYNKVGDTYTQIDGITTGRPTASDYERSLLEIIKPKLATECLHQLSKHDISPTPLTLSLIDPTPLTLTLADLQTIPMLQTPYTMSIPHIPSLPLTPPAELPLFPPAQKASDEDLPPFVQGRITKGDAHYASQEFKTAAHYYSEAIAYLADIETTFSPHKLLSLLRAKGNIWESFSKNSWLKTASLYFNNIGHCFNHLNLNSQPYFEVSKQLLQVLEIRNKLAELEAASSTTVGAVADEVATEEDLTDEELATAKPQAVILPQISSEKHVDVLKNKIATTATDILNNAVAQNSLTTSLPEVVENEASASSSAEIVNKQKKKKHKKKKKEEKSVNNDDPKTKNLDEKDVTEDSSLSASALESQDVSTPATKTLSREQKLEKAIESLNESIALDPANSKYHNELGRIYFEKDMFDNAIEEYQKAINLDASKAIYYNNLGIVYEYIKRYEDAAAVYIKAAIADPYNTEYLANYADALIYQNPDDISNQIFAFIAYSLANLEDKAYEIANSIDETSSTEDVAIDMKNHATITLETAKSLLEMLRHNYNLRSIEFQNCELSPDVKDYFNANISTSFIASIKSSNWGCFSQQNAERHERELPAEILEKTQSIDGLEVFLNHIRNKDFKYELLVKLFEIPHTPAAEIKHTAILYTMYHLFQSDMNTYLSLVQNNSYNCNEHIADGLSELCNKQKAKGMVEFILSWLEISGTEYNVLDNLHIAENNKVNLCRQFSKIDDNNSTAYEYLFRVISSRLQNTHLNALKPHLGTNAKLLSILDENIQDDEDRPSSSNSASSEASSSDSTAEPSANRNTSNSQPQSAKRVESWTIGEKSYKFDNVHIVKVENLTNTYAAISCPTFSQSLNDERFKLAITKMVKQKSGSNGIKKNCPYGSYELKINDGSRLCSDTEIEADNSNARLILFTDLCDTHEGAARWIHSHREMHRYESGSYNGNFELECIGNVEE